MQMSTWGPSTSGTNRYKSACSCSNRLEGSAEAATRAACHRRESGGIAVTEVIGTILKFGNCYRLATQRLARDQQRARSWLVLRESCAVG